VTHLFTPQHHQPQLVILQYSHQHHRLQLVIFLYSVLHQQPVKPQLVPMSPPPKLYVVQQRASRLLALLRVGQMLPAQKRPASQLQVWKQLVQHSVRHLFIPQPHQLHSAKPPYIHPHQAQHSVSHQSTVQLVPRPPVIHRCIRQPPHLALPQVARTLPAPVPNAQQQHPLRQNVQHSA
jgi:hypothetical protein